MSSPLYPKVVVGILTFNSSKYLPKCLEALVAQDYPNFDMIIVDDCSSDDSFEKCRLFSGNYKNVKVFKTPKNLGVVGAINFLLERVSGAFFLWACPDDHWSTNFIGNCVASLLKSKSSVAMGVVKNIWDNNQVENDYIYTDLDMHPSTWQVMKSIINAKDFSGKRISYNQFIHGLMTTDAAYILARAALEIWIHEELLVCILACLGLCYAPDCYHYNLHSIESLSVRNPSFAKIKFSSRKYWFGMLKFYFYMLMLNKISFKNKMLLLVASCVVISNRFKFKIQGVKCHMYDILKQHNWVR